MNCLHVLLICGLIATGSSLLCYNDLLGTNQTPHQFTICAYTPMTNRSTGVDYENDDRVHVFNRLLHRDSMFQVNFMCMNEQINLDDDRQRNLRCYCNTNLCNTKKNFDKYITQDGAPVTHEEMRLIGL
ncbi:hypothetical protein QR680_000785 [Steinernema hermaphroditum]|uniref:Uncharacterized protein n=1 Tax=Steinernema hermaphroditum TaxID=289476 RepID=A0AA39LEP3_9BILA|nr:hypothetical protein QR680_000785 [Steinernema hermaphroditum]